MEARKKKAKRIPFWPQVCLFAHIQSTEAWQAPYFWMEMLKDEQLSLFTISYAYLRDQAEENAETADSGESCG